VTLQGAEETYAKWAEVERFAVPRSLFSESDHIEVEDDHDLPKLEDETVQKLAIFGHKQKGSISSVTTATTGSISQVSSSGDPVVPYPLSPPTSPAKALSPTTAELKVEDAVKMSTMGGSGMPPRLQPLFNYILWRIHQELDPVAALETFIFLCNDPVKVHAAKGFDVRCKRLEQLRDAVGREERDVRNRLSVQSKEGQSVPVVASVAARETSPKSPPTAPAAMISPQAKVIDPDAFTRKVQSVESTSIPPRTPPFNNTFSAANRGATRGMNRGNFPGSPRGRGGFPNSPGSPRVNFPSSGARRGGPPTTQVDAQIDPNSFERPRGGYAGRGAGRKLWVPT
jgi:hypothetical protein